MTSRISPICEKYGHQMFVVAVPTTLGIALLLAQIYQLTAIRGAFRSSYLGCLVRYGWRVGLCWAVGGILSV